MKTDQRNVDRDFGDLPSDMAESGVLLMGDVARLERIELGDVVAGIGRGTFLVATGAVLLLIWALALVAGLVLVVGDQWLPEDRYWLAALIVMLIAGGLALWLAKRGFCLVSPSRLAP